MKTQYKIYPTLLDAYQRYLNAEETWEKYWGFSENPPHTAEEFSEQAKQELLDKINRKPFDSLAADRGTAFNELIDHIVSERPSSRATITPIGTDNPTAYRVELNDRAFIFPTEMVKQTADKYREAVCQKLLLGTIDTIYGMVELYGYADYINPLSLHDLKTTGSYAVGKFKQNWQHVVYPYLLAEEGITMTRFDYDIVLLTPSRQEEDGAETYREIEFFTETYLYRPSDAFRLKCFLERFIEFLEENRDQITDTKIFAS